MDTPAWLTRWQQRPDDELLSPSELRAEQERPEGPSMLRADYRAWLTASLRQMAAERWPADGVEETAL